MEEFEAWSGTPCTRGKPRGRRIEDASGDAPPPPSFGEDPTHVVVPLRLGHGVEERRRRGFGRFGETWARLLKDLDVLKPSWRISVIGDWVLGVFTEFKFVFL